MKISFIQLSDIHFNKDSGNSYDIDNALRSALLEDIKNEAKKELENIDGLLVCGDIAFSAQPNEYKTAKDFLQQVSDVFELSLSKVYCVAGNHDIDQSLTKSSKLLQLAQKSLVELDQNNAEAVDREIDNLQNDPHVKGILFSALKNYNLAVEEMSSNYSIVKPNWKSSMRMGDYTLWIYGMNSVITSSHLDHYDDFGKRMYDKERKMVINQTQIPIPERNNIYLTMCHHPPECWSNQELSQFMDKRIRIQLYGHIHKQSIDANDERIRIYSGALQPEHGAGWKPQYNWIQLYIEGDTLLIDIYPREYERVSGCFVSETTACESGQIFKRCRLNLKTDDEAKHLLQIAKTNEIGRENVRTMNETIKDIVYELFQLNVMQKNQLKKRYPDISFESFNTTPEDLDSFINWLRQENREQEFLKELRGLL